MGAFRTIDPLELLVAEMSVMDFCSPAENKQIQLRFTN